MALDALVDSAQLDSALTSVANAIRTKGGTSASLAFPNGFVDAIDAISAGGGSGLIVSSGTYIGNGDYKATVPVGVKMPKTDFLFEMKLDTEVELPYDSRYKTLLVSVLSYRNLGAFDLTSDGRKSPISQTQYQFYNSGGTLSAFAPVRVIAYAVALSNGSGFYGDFQSESVRVIRDANGFSVYMNRNNSSFPFLSGETYYWNLYYFGSDPQNDIVEVV